MQIGLIGGGNISETHARAAKAIPGVEIAAVFGPSLSKIERLCREYGGTPYTQFDSFLKHRPMKFVVIGSPSGVHAEQGIAAAENGLHVLTEKPIDISTARAEALIDAADHAGVKVGVLFQDRLKPNILRMKRAIESGLLGKTILVEARVKWYRPPEYYANSKWRGTLAMDGGGALINQGIHTVDLLLWMFGDVSRVQARTATLLHPIEGEDTVVATLEFASGALGVLHATTAAYPGYPRRLEASGSNGTIVLEQDRIVSADLRSGAEELLRNDSRDENLSASSAVVSDVRGHQAMIEDFIRAIETGSSPACDGREGRSSIELVEAIYIAGKSGNSYDLSKRK
jgi:UDP-N-acetyl-2-amino-2-deoxyglucuronate dehydrogenase